jgi:hypothetical protein
MDTIITTQSPPALASDSFASNIRRCGHCGLPYDWRRSPSGSLKMTYCGSLCERADMGFTIESILQTERSPWGAVLASAAA